MGLIRMHPIASSPLAGQTVYPFVQPALQPSAGFPLGPRQSLCWRKGARREVSLRLCRMNCHRQFIPTTTASGCRGFESRQR